jgi:hypothetical protein
MSIDTVKIADTIVLGLKSVGASISSGAKWLGRSVSNGWTNYIVPAVSRVWGWTVIGANYAWQGLKTAGSFIANFLRTPVGLGSAGIAFGVALIASAEVNALQKAHLYLEVLALRIAGAAAIIAGGLSIGVGIATANRALI